MPDDPVYELASLLAGRAEDTLSFIPNYISLGDYHTVLNRSYYAAFYAMKAVEIIDGYDSKKHSGVIAFFRQNYIKPGFLSSELSNWIGRLEQYREMSDYNVTERFDRNDAEEQYRCARLFVEKTMEFYKKKCRGE